MLIIFDLDDTLIDTSGSIAPFKLYTALKQMVVKGLAVPDFSQAIQELFQIDATSPSSRESLRCLGAKYGATQQQISAGEEELTASLPADFKVVTTPGVPGVLERLARRFSLVLVTAGKVRYQEEKLEKAGLDRSLFSKIVVSEEGREKGPFYEVVLREFSLYPLSSVWVCGDRLEIDLAPAKKLGCKVTHMKWGRGRREKTPSWVDGSVVDLLEFERMV